MLPPLPPQAAPNTDIPVALIGLAGSVAGALIAVFAAEIRKLLTGRKTKSDLKAEWLATWTITDPPNHPKSGLVDRVEFKDFSGDEFKGTGDNADFGKYEIAGRDARIAVSLVMRGRDAKASLLGTAILTKDPLVETLTGPWAQYTASGIVVSGTVRMEKQR
jgi:hypothetical protein